VNLAFRFCRDRAQAEELAQEAFLKIYRNLGKWRGDATFSTWLFAVATNVCRSWIRRRGLPTIPLEALEVADASPGADAELDSRDRQRQVREAVLSLPPRYRDSLILFYFMEMDIRSAAAVLEVAEGTLKAQLHRARKKLAAHLPRAADLRAEGTGTKTWTGSIEYSSLKKN
jgi:RNA polymerase sigma-70 factor (ECF subfamily)